MILFQLLQLCCSSLLTSGFPSGDTANNVPRSQDTKGKEAKNVCVETGNPEGMQTLAIHSAVDIVTKGRTALLKRIRFCNI
jgi:hypothetical protein